MTSFATLADFCVNWSLLLAEEAHYIQMGSRFRQRGSGIAWTDLLFPAAVMICAVGTAWLVSRAIKHRAKQIADSPQTLFAELCQAHGLDWPNQQLLRALAAAHRLASPAQLFLEPERFETESLGSAFEGRAGQVAALRATLFNDRPGDPPQAG